MEVWGNLVLYLGPFIYGIVSLIIGFAITIIYDKKIFSDYTKQILNSSDTKTSINTLQAYVLVKHLFLFILFLIGALLVLHLRGDSISGGGDIFEWPVVWACRTSIRSGFDYTDDTWLNLNTIVY